MPLPPVHLVRDHPRAVVERNLRDGTWLRLRLGACVDARPPGLSDDDERRRLALARVVAVHAQLGVVAVSSHTSAALVRGLPAVTEPLTHVIQRHRPSGERSADVVRHVHRLEQDERTVVRGIPVTTLVRTVVDCTTSTDPARALVLADAAAHVGVDLEACRAALATRAGRRGVAVARAVLDLADGGSESPGETLTRWTLLRAGLEPPETQVRVTTAAGDAWGDLGWRGWRLLVEYDGRAKYRAAGSTADVVLGEKRREDAIREAGWRVLRVVAADLRRPEVLVARVLRFAPPGTEPRRVRPLLSGA